MTLTPEQIDRLIQQADGLAPKEGSIFPGAGEAH